MAEASTNAVAWPASVGAGRVALRDSSMLARLVWPALALVAGIAAVAPLWSSTLLPFQDAPEHVAAIRVLADFHTAGFGFERWFQIDLARLQYLAFYLPAAFLSHWVGPQAACRLVLSLIALALPLSVWMLLGAFGRDRRLAVLAPVVFHSQTTYLGFFNFVESVPAAIAVVALFERELRSPKWTRAVVLAVLSSVLLWLHPSAVAFALGAAGVLALTSGQSRRRIGRAAVPLLPSVGLFVMWAAQALAHRDGPGVSAHSAPEWLGWKLQTLDLLRFGNVLAGHADELFWAALVGLWLMAVWVPGRPRPPRAWRLPLLAGLAFVGYFALPYQVGFMGYIHLRALPFLVLLALAAPCLAPGRRTSVLLAAAVLLQVGYAVVLSRVYRAFDDEAQVTQLETVLHAAAPGARLVGLIWNQESKLVQFKSYLHFAQYYEVERGGRARVNFADAPWTPVRYRPGTEPPALPFGWEEAPGRFDPARDGAEADYLLVRGGPAPTGPFVLESAAGSWALYQRR